MFDSSKLTSSQRRCLYDLWVAGLPVQQKKVGAFVVIISFETQQMLLVYA